MPPSNTHNRSQKKPRLVSVVIPVHNRNDLLKDAISSVFSQRSTSLISAREKHLFELEIIIVDDGSKHPISIDPEPRIKVIRHKTNTGAGAARNTGVQHSNGDYIAFLDSDDTWTENKLAQQVEKLDASEPDIFGVFCPFAKVTPQTRKFVPRKTKKTWFDTFLGGCRVAPGSTLMFRKSLWDTVGPQSGALKRFEDWDWLLRASQAYDFEFINTEFAILGRSKRPNFEIVDQSLENLEARWRPKLNRGQSVRLSSAIAIERSAHAKANGQLIQFAKNFFDAIFRSPSTVAENLSWRYWR